MSDFTVDIERETDGRWIGEVTELPGVLVYGGTRDEAVAKAKALAFRVLADRLEHGENIVGSTMLRDTLIGKHGEGEGNRLYRERFLDPHNERIRALLAKHEGSR